MIIKQENLTILDNMKKIITLLMVVSTWLSVQAQNYDFSGITFEKFSQRANEMYFRTNMDMDDCWRYYFTAYDYQTKRLDTLEDWGGRTGVSFNVKGKYQMRLNVVNICKKCDTVLTIEVDITIFHKMGYSGKAASKNCKAYRFELDNREDTCYKYYYNVYKADKWINDMSDEKWSKLTTNELYFGYSWAEDLVMYYSTKSERVMDFEFDDSGRYFIIPMVYNECSGIDTWAIEKLDVCKPIKTTSVKTIVKNADLRVIGYYDMMGRQVDYMRPNEVYVVFYSNGQRRKVMQVQN